MIELDYSVTGITNLFANLSPLGDRTVTTSVSLTELLDDSSNPTGIYSGTPTTLTAGAYSVRFRAGSNPIYTDAAIYYWDGTKEVTPAALSNLISTRSSHAAPDLSGLATLTSITNAQTAITAYGDTNWSTVELSGVSSAIAAIPTNPLLADDYTAPDLSNLATQSDVTAAFNNIDLSGLSTFDPTTDQVTLTAASASAAKADVSNIDVGDIEVTIDTAAIATAVKAALQTQLDNIDSNSELARKVATNGATVDLVNATATVFDDDDTTELLVFDLTDASGNPVAIGSTTRTRKVN